MFKQLLSYLLPFLFLLTFACNRPQNQQLAVEEAVEPTEAPEEPRIPKHVPIDQIIEQAEKVITLTEDQKLEIYQLADQYNYDRLSPQEQKALRQELRQTVFTDILTDEQRRRAREALQQRGGN
jgi:hypothetical protein